MTISGHKSFAELIDLTSQSKPEDIEIISIDCSPEQQEVIVNVSKPTHVLEKFIDLAQAAS